MYIIREQMALFYFFLIRRFEKMSILKKYVDVGKISWFHDIDYYIVNSTEKLVPGTGSWV